MISKLRKWLLVGLTIGNKLGIQQKDGVRFNKVDTSYKLAPAYGFQSFNYSISISSGSRYSTLNFRAFGKLYTVESGV